jgi:nucleoside-diphosphate-sugar epimerase
MRVFVAGAAGAAGAIGQQLLPQLTAQGHQVTATTRSPGWLELLRGLGAEAVVVDGLDAAAVGEAVARSEPEVVVHQMTSLAGVTSLRRFDQGFAATNRLRTDGTDHVLRYGFLYGPGASDAFFSLIRKRRVPIIGDGAGIWSFLHVCDAAAATVAALDRGQPGLYNVVDDEPASVAQWLPFLAQAVGAKAWPSWRQGFRDAALVPGAA